jgi:hypothetical protein
MTKLTPHRDPITKKILTPEPPYKAGQGIIRKSHETIAPSIEREQKRQNDGHAPSRK